MKTQVVSYYSQSILMIPTLPWTPFLKLRHVDMTTRMFSCSQSTWRGGANYWGDFDNVKDVWTAEGILFWSPTKGDTGTRALRQTHICERLE